MAARGSREQWDEVMKDITPELKQACAPKRSNDAREGVETMKWISVEDRLPERQAWVLVAHKYSKNKPALITMAYLDNFPELQCWRTSWYYYDTLENVTHWMHLPKPPKEG